LGIGPRPWLCGEQLVDQPLAILIIAAVVLLVGIFITLLSGEMFDEPWLVLVDIGQVAAAALIGIFMLPAGVLLLQRTMGSEI
jgi:hypothetical protein